MEKSISCISTRLTTRDGKKTKNNKCPNLDIEKLPQGQASNQRHKSPYIAYVLGYQAGYLNKRPLNP